MALASPPRCGGACLQHRPARPLALLLSVNVSTIGRALFAPRWHSIRKAGLQSKDLTVFIFARFAAINEVFKHGQIIASDIINCEHKMETKSSITMSRRILKELHGDSARERLLHRLHGITLVLVDFPQAKRRESMVIRRAPSRIGSPALKQPVLRD